MKRILFLGICHRPNDPRLYHREMRILWNTDPACKFYFLKPVVTENVEAISVSKQTVSFDEIPINYIQVHYPNYSLNSQIPIWKKQRLNREIHCRLFEEACCINPDIVQASDVREIFLAIRIAKHNGAFLIYDSHEDYFMQMFEYNRRSFYYWLKATKLYSTELFYLRFFNSVFCTDDFLYKKYCQRLFAIKKIKLLRNFPFAPNIQSHTCLEQKDFLDLVYIGGVNQYRGIRECAEFSARFNQEHSDKRLNFTVYAPFHPILDQLKSRSLIQHINWIDYAELMHVLPNYDVGVCLWHPIQKFRRNLPLKNFDYMSCGLPVLTSKFGNLKIYLDRAKAGIGINPFNYSEFKHAILRLFDPLVRLKFSNNGLNWVKREGNFQTESRHYVDTVLGNLNRRS